MEIDQFDFKQLIKIKKDISVTLISYNLVLDMLALYLLLSKKETLYNVKANYTDSLVSFKNAHGAAIAIHLKEDKRC